MKNPFLHLVVLVLSSKAFGLNLSSPQRTSNITTPSQNESGLTPYLEHVRDSIPLIDLTIESGESRSLSVESSKILVKTAAQLTNFQKMGKINPIYLDNGNKIIVELCQSHFPLRSSSRNEVIKALDEYVQLKGTKISWQILDVPHKNASEIISRNTQAGSLKIDFADAETYPNDCKSQGQGASWNLTRCGFTFGRGWNTANFNGNLDAGAVLINKFKYCPKKESLCLINHPIKQGYLHELAHFFGMTHVSEWPMEQRNYSSTMGAHQDFLTAFDSKYLRTYYSNSTPEIPTEDNLAVIGRFKGDSSEIESGNIEDVNPKKLYYDASDRKIKDCQTSQDAKFQFGLFNRSTHPFGSNGSPVDLEVSSIVGTFSYLIEKIKIYNIPSYSEVIWSFPSDKTFQFTNLPSKANIKIQFKIKVPNGLELDRYKNVLTISLAKDQASCRL